MAFSLAGHMPYSGPYVMYASSLYPKPLPHGLLARSHDRSANAFGTTAL